MRIFRRKKSAKYAAKSSEPGWSLRTMKEFTQKRGHSIVWPVAKPTANFWDSSSTRLLTVRPDPTNVMWATATMLQRQDATGSHTRGGNTVRTHTLATPATKLSTWGVLCCDIRKHMAVKHREWKKRKIKKTPYKRMRPVVQEELVRCVTKPLQMLPTFRATWRATMSKLCQSCPKKLTNKRPKNRYNAMYAREALLDIKEIIHWKLIWEYTLERNHLFATPVAEHLEQSLNWKSINPHTVMLGRFLVTSKAANILQSTNRNGSGTSD